SLEARFQRAVFFIHHERLDDAARELDAALAVRPEDPRLLLAKVVWYETWARMRKRKSADVPAELADHLARTAVSPIELWAAAKYVRGADEALRCAGLLDRALALDPLCWRCYATRAAMLEDTGKLDAALAAVDRAIAILPEGINARPLLAQRRR